MGITSPCLAPKMSGLSLLIMLVAHLVTRCETEGYCSFPPFLWQPIQDGGVVHRGGGGGGGSPYRKWFSRTQYTRNTHTWTRQKEIHAKETEIVIYQRFYATCSGYEHSGDVPCYRKTVETRLLCVAKEPDGKYRVQKRTEGEPHMFACLKFVRRTEFITQIYSAVPNEVNVDKLCYDVALQREEWPWIDILHAPVITCPVRGGFDFRSFLHRGFRRTEKCPEQWRPARLESECIPGEGLQLIFPSEDCSFLDQAPTERTLLCRGDWSEESYRYIVLSDIDGPPRYILRLPVGLDSGAPPPMFAYLYFSLVVPASGRGQPPGSDIYMELRMTRGDTDHCYDESPKCAHYAKEGRCNDSPRYEFANHCKPSCGLCGFVPSTEPECEFQSHYQGNWTLVTGDRLEQVRINGGTIEFSSLQSFVCKNKHWELEYYKVMSVFDNGCRPRYSCIQLLDLGDGMSQFRISNSSLEDKSFDICEFKRTNTPWKPILLNNELKTLFRTDRLHMDFCGLGGEFHTNVTFWDGTNCEGTILDVDHITCRVHEELRVDLLACHSPSIHDYICVAFTQRPLGTSFLTTRKISLDSEDRYQCWVIKQADIYKLEKGRPRVLRFSRAKCSTVEIFSPMDSFDFRGIVSMETFNDVVDSDCDTVHGAMERHLQGSTGLAVPVSEPPYSLDSYNNYWSRGQGKEEESAAIKRTTVSGSGNAISCYCHAWTLLCSSLLIGLSWQIGVDMFVKGHV